MLRIGICDENTKDRTVIRQIVTDTLFREEELSYIEYAEAETLEQEIQASTVPFDLLLMEMKYKNTSGLQLAKQIREKNLDVDLLFVTDESDHVYEGYHVQAQGYVLKEDMKTQLPDCLRQYMKRRAQDAASGDGADDCRLRAVSDEPACDDAGVVRDDRGTYGVYVRAGQYAGDAAGVVRCTGSSGTRCRHDAAGVRADDR